MAALPENFVISEAGDWDYERLIPGGEYALEFVQEDGGVFPTSITVLFACGVGDSYVDVSENTFDTDNRGGRFIAPCRDMRFVVEGDPGEFRVSLTLMVR